MTLLDPQWEIAPSRVVHAILGRLHRAWTSPTLMSWMSVLARALGAVVVLPLVVTRLPVEEIALWYLFATLISLQQVADLGFAPTFVRVIAYAVGGATELKGGERKPSTKIAGTRFEILAKIWQTMQVVYTRLGLAFGVLFALFGSLALQRPIGQVDNPAFGWLAWSIILVTFVLTFRASAYSAYLQGTGNVALVRRWEALFGIGAAFTSALVLVMGGTLVSLVLANQVWMIATAARNWWLCRQVGGELVRPGNVPRRADPDVMEAVWGSAIRSGLGMIFSRGVIASSGVIFAQVSDPVALASYLLAVRVMQLILDFSNAPFYSKVPALAALKAQGRDDEMLQLAQKGMALTYWTYVLLVSAAAVTAAPMLALLGSNAPWVTDGLWIAMSAAYFVERFGALHIQLYSTTNHIIWHIANGVSGALYLVISTASLGALGVVSFPVALLISNAAFYSWYAAMHVRRAFRFDFVAFQRQTVLAPLLALLACAVALRMLR